MAVIHKPPMALPASLGKVAARRPSLCADALVFFSKDGKKRHEFCTWCLPWRFAGRTFHLQGKTYCYVFYVSPEGYLLNFHYGKHLPPADYAVKYGYASVPDGPGLGIEVSDEAIEAYRCDRIPTE